MKYPWHFSRAQSTRRHERLFVRVCACWPVTTRRCKQPWPPSAGSYISSLTGPKLGALRRGGSTHLGGRQKLSQRRERAQPRRPALPITAGRLSAWAPEWRAMSRLASFTWRCRRSPPPTRYSGFCRYGDDRRLIHSPTRDTCSTPEILPFHWGFIFVLIRKGGSADRKSRVSNTIGPQRIVRVRPKYCCHEELSSTFGAENGKYDPYWHSSPGCTQYLVDTA